MCFCTDMRLRGIVVAAACLIPATLPGTAVPAPSAQLATAVGAQAWEDAVGDNGGTSPDLVQTQISNDDAGRFEVRITLANRGDLLDGDSIDAYLDTDRNISTGCGPSVIGAEFVIGMLGHADPRPDFVNVTRCIRSRPDRYTPQRTFASDYDAATGTAVFRFGCAEIGRPSSFRIVVASQTGSDAAATFDFAGDQVPWIYDVRPACAPDRSAPQVRALPSGGTRGGEAKLWFRAVDDSGYVKEQFRVFKKKRLLARTTTIDFGAADVTKRQFVRYPIPRHAPHGERFCVDAWDEANNHSKTSCAPLRIG